MWTCDTTLENDAVYFNFDFHVKNIIGFFFSCEESTQIFLLNILFVHIIFKNVI